MDTNRLTDARRARSPYRWLCGRGTTATALLLLVTLGSSAPSAQRGNGRGAARTPNDKREAARFDKHLEERLSAEGDDAFQRVIVTMRPGTKRRVVGELRGQGHRVEKDFDVIEGFAGQISG